VELVAVQGAEPGQERLAVVSSTRTARASHRLLIGGGLLVTGTDGGENEAAPVGASAVPRAPAVPVQWWRIEARRLGASPFTSLLCSAPLVAARARAVASGAREITAVPVRAGEANPVAGGARPPAEHQQRGRGEVGRWQRCRRAADAGTLGLDAGTRSRWQRPPCRLTHRRPEMRAAPLRASAERILRRSVVLNDHERKTLREVERRFMAEDPEFPRSFDDVGRRHSTCSLQWPSAMPRWAYAMGRWISTTALVLAVALAALMIMVVSPGAALVFAVLATIIGVSRERGDETDRRES
jgi:hypothetical protein